MSFPKPLYALFLLLSILFSSNSFANDLPQWLRVYSDGTFKIEGLIFGKIVIYDQSWKPSSQSPSTLSNIKKQAGSYSGKLSLINKNAFDMNETIKAKANGFTYQANLKSVKEQITVNRLCLSLEFPINTYSGKIFKADDNRFELPKINGKVALASGKTKSISISLQKGVLQISSANDIGYLLQDNRKYNNSSYSLRLLFTPDKGKIKQSTINLEFALLPSSKEQTTKEDATMSHNPTIKRDHVPVIILKLDDLVRATPLMEKCVDYLIEQNVPASFGIIGYSLEKPNKQYIKLIEKMKETGLFEFWNHGYMKRTPKDKLGEFEVESAAKQKESLLKTNRLAKEKLGVTMTVFGPHWSGTNHATEKALVETPQIRAVFYYTKKQPERDWFVFERRFVLEQPIFQPNLENIKKRFNAGDWKRPYLALQGHPDQWNRKPESFDIFKSIVQYFKAQGCQFMTPTQYLDSLNKKDCK